METESAVILFAGLRGFLSLAGTQTTERISQTVQAFQQIGQKVIDDYRRTEGLADDRMIARGDWNEFYLVLTGGYPNEDECHALAIAMRLDQAWLSSPAGRDLAAFKENPYGISVDLVMAVGCGDVELHQDTWTGGRTVAGRAIAEVQHLERMAEDPVTGACVLVTLEIKEAAERAGLGLNFSKRIPVRVGLPVYSVVMQSIEPVQISQEEY